MHPSGLFGCILVFRNEETATWAGGETTEAGDPEEQELEFAAAALYLGTRAFPRPPLPQCQPIKAWSSKGPSEREGEGAREAGVFVHHFSSQITNWCRLIRNGRKNPFLALKKQFLQNTMSKRFQFPLKFKGKAVIRVPLLGKRQF